MADVSKIFKPRRGKKSTMTGTKASTILAAGELFVEVPEAGVGKGAGKLKMGDGSTTYDNLPYLMGDTSNDKITYSVNTRDSVANALADIYSGGTLANIIAAIKQAIYLTNVRVDGLNTNLSGKAATSHTHDDRYFTESEITTKLQSYSTTSHTHSGYASTSHIHNHMKSLNSVYTAAIQGDGNFVVYDSSNKAIFDTKSALRGSLYGTTLSITIG